MRCRTPMPALFTTTSRPPSAAAAEATSRSAWTGSATSAWTTACGPPGSPASVAFAAASSARKPIATRAPRLANACATARPIPREPPVTSTDRSRRFMARVSLLAPPRSPPRSPPPSPPPSRPRLVRDQDRSLRQPDDALGDAAVHEVRHAGTSVRAHHDQVGAPALGLRQDRLDRRPDPHDGGLVRPGDGPELLQDLPLHGVPLVLRGHRRGELVRDPLGVQHVKQAALRLGEVLPSQPHRRFRGGREVGGQKDLHEHGRPPRGRGYTRPPERLTRVPRRARRGGRAPRAWPAAPRRPRSRRAA